MRYEHRSRPPRWPDVLAEHAADDHTAARLIGQLAACEVAALAFCRLLERWGRGEAEPSTVGRAPGRLPPPSGPRPRCRGWSVRSRYLLELEPGSAEGRSWYGEPGTAELLDWSPVLARAGVRVSEVRVAQAYLELAVLVRALEGLSTAARMRSAPTARRSGPASSTCARTCSAARSRTCARLPPELTVVGSANLDLVGASNGCRGRARP